jgi:hypothetical protein
MSAKTIEYKGVVYKVGQLVNIIKPACQEGKSIITECTYIDDDGDLCGLEPDKSVKYSLRGGTYARELEIIYK